MRNVSMYKYIDFLIGAIAGAAFLRLFFWPEFSETHQTQVKTETKVEIITVRDTVYLDRIVTRTKLVEVQAPPPGETFDSLRTYRGSERFAYGKLDWQATTGGTLEGLTFSPSWEIPTTTVTTTVTETKTIAKESPALYAVAGFNDQGTLRAGVSYTKNKFVAGYRYEPAIKSHYFEVGLKIF
jgi:hypothetical protein